jgi:hypothetical protein
MLGLGLLGCVILPSYLSVLFSDFTLPGVTKESYSLPAVRSRKESGVAMNRTQAFRDKPFDADEWQKLYYRNQQQYIRLVGK